MSTTIQTPEPLSNLMGAYDSAHWLTEVREIKSGIGTLIRGTVLAEGAALDAGKLVLLTAGTENAAYGILLDPEIDTTVLNSDGSVTGSVARAGSFKGGKLIVPAGIDAAALTTRLREIGIFTEGPIIVPA